jgi:predicted O-linked N-acetylglucosamine transferase (SPINDLY family)
MDGLIADPYHVHPGEGCWYTEKVLRMPHDYICYGPPDEVPEVGPLPALKSGIFTFGCFNNPAKYSPSMLDAWAMILRRVPSSQLFLKYGGLDHTEFQNRIRGQMTARGVAPERIVFEGGSRNLELMARYGEVDLALDTRPYSGGLTTCEALWMGVPVVTCPGQTFASRHSTSHLTNAGYGEFIANDLESYIELAIHWSSHLDELSAIRTQMRERVRQSPLCDAPRFGQDLLALLQHAWSADT